MSTILSVGSVPVQDDTIVKQEYVAYDPYTTSYGLNDEVRIAIHSQDHYVLPSESYIIVEYKMTPVQDAREATYGTNATSFMFSEVRYELNNIEIDRIKNPGITTLLKRSCAYKGVQHRLKNQIDYYNKKTISNKNYQILIPLSYLLGFCDDYNKIIMNAKHELILVRSRSNMNVYISESEGYALTVTKIRWKMPHIQLSDHAKLSMFRYLERKQTITVPYRSWDLYEMPQLPTTSRHIWTVKSTTQTSKPRYIFVGFQTDRLKIAADAGKFDYANIESVKLFLNAQCYPYDNYQSKFADSMVQDLYNSYLRIQRSYYPECKGDNPYDYFYEKYLTAPIFAFDCSRSDESLLGGSVDIRLEIDAGSNNIVDKTAAYCLIIYENQFEYSPFSGIVVKST